MGDARVLKTLRFTYFGDTLLVDLGDDGSVRFRIGDRSIQITSDEFGQILGAHSAVIKEIVDLKQALAPLAKIADQWEQDGLDESRPGSWGHTREHAETIEIYSGRGGSQLLTLKDAFHARDILRKYKT